MSRPRIVKLAENVHMGLGHDGLAKLLKRAKIDVADLKDSDLVLCLNTFGDKMKVIGCKGLVVGYLKLPNKQRIMKEALQYIPNTFGSGGFDYDAACKTALMERLNVKAHVVASPLTAAKAKREAGL